MPLMPPFHDTRFWYWLVFMLTDSRCCWQYWALSISRTYNSEKDILKHGFRASNTNFFTSTFLYCLAFSVYEVRLACQSCSLNKPNMQLTNYPNGFINTKSHTCKRETCSQAEGGRRTQYHTERKWGVGLIGKKNGDQEKGRLAENLELQLLLQKCAWVLSGINTNWVVSK